MLRALCVNIKISFATVAASTDKLNTLLRRPTEQFVV